jgi:hypothetical protein
MGSISSRFVSNYGWTFFGGDSTGTPPLPTGEVWNEHYVNRYMNIKVFGRWNDLWCCRDVMALLAVVGTWDDGGIAELWKEEMWQEYGIHYAVLKPVKVGIWISIKGVVNKYYEGKAYAYHIMDHDHGEQSYGITAGAFVSCECGLNIYSVWIGGEERRDENGKRVGEIFETHYYLGTEKKDYDWAVCCGDNHLLVGKGEQGWHPVINLATPLEWSTLVLDDKQGTVCYPTVKRDRLYSGSWDEMLDLIVELVEQVQNKVITYEQMMELLEKFMGEGEITSEAYIDTWHFTDSEGKTRTFPNQGYIPVKYEKDKNYTVHASTRTHVDNNSEEFVEDDTLYAMRCWAHQYNKDPYDGETDHLLNDGAGNNSRDVAFMTFGARGVFPEERVTRYVEDPLTGKITIDTVALEVKDNHKHYSGHRLHGRINRLKHPAEAYLQKARERSHRRSGIYARIDGETQTSNPDFDANGNLVRDVTLDFDHLAEGKHPDANLRLYVDDKESWYRYDRLPSNSGLDEEPVGIHWNHPDAALHRTTVWSGNGELYISHPE